jgi:hypothetical protein
MRSLVVCPTQKEKCYVKEEKDEEEHNVNPQKADQVYKH